MAARTSRPGSAGPPITVTLVDGDGVVLDGLAAILARAPEDFEVVARIRVVALLEGGVQPESALVVYDPHEGADAAAAVLALLERAPAADVVVLGALPPGVRQADHLHVAPSSLPLPDLLELLRSIARSPH